MRDPKDSYLAEHPQKQPRKSSIQPTSEHIPIKELAASHALTQSNLQRFNELFTLSAQEKMDTRLVASSRGRGSRRPTQASSRRTSRNRSRHSLSTRSTATDLDLETLTQRSQKTSCTAASYRFTDLESARIYIEVGLPPEEVQERVKAVVQSEIPPARKELLTKLAKDFCGDFLKILRGAAGEDDCIEVLYKTLSCMFPGDKCMHSRKAGMVLYLFSVILSNTTTSLRGMLIRDVHLIS